DPGVGNGTPFTVTPGDFIDMNTVIQTAGIPIGYHNAFVRVTDENGKWGIYDGKPFYVYDDEYKNVQKDQKYIAGAEYFFDTDPGIGKATPISFNIYDTVEIDRYVPVADLDTGYHYFYLRVLDENQNWSIWQRDTLHIHHVNCTCPIVDFTADTVNVLGNTTTFTNLSDSLFTGATYEWDVDNDSIIDYTTANITHVYPGYGIFDAKLTVYNSDSCYASFIREVVVSPAIDTSLIIVGPTEFCEGGSVMLTAQPGYSYNWNSGEITQSIVVEQAGSYKVRLTNAYGMQDHSRTVLVTVFPLANVEFTTIDATGGIANGTSICDVTGGSGSYTYNWSTGGILSIENNLPEGDHYVIVNDGFCPVQKDFHIYNNPVYPGDVVFAEYYFNEDDPGVGNGQSLNIAGGDSVYFATYIPATSLPVGYHKIHIRVSDDRESWSHLLTEEFYVYFDSLQYQAPVIQPPLTFAEYFFDGDPGTGNGVPVTITQGDSIDENFGVNTAGLDVGYHIVGFRVMDSLSKWGINRHDNFYIYDSTKSTVSTESYKIIAAEYFYDEDPGVGNGIEIEFTPTGDSIEMERCFPVTGLDPGDHRIYVRTKDEDGKWGIYEDQPFVVQAVSCTCPDVDFASNIVNPGSATSFTNLSGNTITGTTYQWDIFNDGSVDFTTENIDYSFSGSGMYDVKLTVINSDSCYASAINQVLVGPMPNPIVTIQGDTEYCDGDSVVLTASAGLSYEWWPTGETTQSISAKASGTYYVWVTTSSGIELKSANHELTKHDVPEFTLTAIDATGGNSNGSAFVEATGGSGDYGYLWSTAGTEFFVNNLSSGNYNVEINDGHCPVDSTFFIDNLAVVPGNIVAAEYFFKGDPGFGLGTPLNVAAGDTVEFLTGFSVTGLPLGYHDMYVRTKDTYGAWSFMLHEPFHIYDTTSANLQAIQPPLVAAEFFIDINVFNKLDPGVGLGSPISVTPGNNILGDFNYAADSLEVGFHKVFVRAEDDDDKWSHFEYHDFHVYDTTYYDLTKVQPEIVEAEYFIDTDPG
ncbi:MAG: hypothetical protein DRJ05_16875, partial [Bacteroidetes bacterium]